MNLKIWQACGDLVKKSCFVLLVVEVPQKKLL